MFIVGVITSTNVIEIKVDKTVQDNKRFRSTSQQFTIMSKQFTINFYNILTRSILQNNFV